MLISGTPGSFAKGPVHHRLRLRLSCPPRALSSGGLSRTVSQSLVFRTNRRKNPLDSGGRFHACFRRATGRDSGSQVELEVPSSKEFYRVQRKKALFALVFQSERLRFDTPREAVSQESEDEGGRPIDHYGFQRAFHAGETRDD